MRDFNLGEYLNNNGKEKMKERESKRTADSELIDKYKNEIESKIGDFGICEVFEDGEVIVENEYGELYSVFESSIIDKLYIRRKEEY
jgi:hypothetical protein